MDEISNQLDMFTTPKAAARETDPETSWEAALNITGMRESQAKIWFILFYYEPKTDEEIYNLITFHYAGMISESGCRTRRKELVDLGLVKFAKEWGETKLGNRSRRWRAVPLDIWREKEFSKHHQIERAFK